MWIGWYRRGPTAPWQPAAEDEDLGRCHHQLLPATPVDTPSLNRCLTSGVSPADLPGVVT
jgi:hypothetical protein